MKLRRSLRTTARFPSISGKFDVRDVESAGGQQIAVITSGQFHTVVLQCDLAPGVEVATLAHQWLHLWGDRIGIEENNTDLMGVTSVLTFDPPGDTAGFDTWCRGEVPSGEVIPPLALVSLTFRIRGGRDVAESAPVILGVRLPAIIRSLTLAGLRPYPLTSDLLISHLSGVFAPRTEFTSTDLPVWSQVVPTGTEETRHHLSHPDRSKTVSWLVSSRSAEVTDMVLTRAMTSTMYPRRRVAMTYRRTNSEQQAVLRRQISAVSAVLPRGGEAAAHGLLGIRGDGTSVESRENGPRSTTELPVAARVALRRGYDRQGELATLTSGLGLVLPEQAVIGEHPVIADYFDDDQNLEEAS